MPKTICISGQKRNGKSILCDYLLEKLNSQNNSYPENYWEAGSFADSVKRIYSEAFGVSRQFIEEWKCLDKIPPGMLKPVRQGLQFIGDGFRQIKSDIWIDILLRDKEKNLVISDGRYINEAKASKDRNGINIILWRPGFENDDPNPSEAQILPLVNWCLSTEQDGVIKHFYEEEGMTMPEMQYYDIFLRNDGTVEDLVQKIDRIIIPFVKDKYFS